MNDRMLQLIEQLNNYSYYYYNENSPLITDKEYDKLFDELLSLEKSTQIVYPNSPTQKVGYEIKSNLEKVNHSFPLLSLNKTKLINEIKNFCSDKQINTMLKLDGLTVELTYENGKLVQGSTRGNGFIGEDITHNIKTFCNVPLTIPNTNKLIITGEAIIPKNYFELINSLLSEDEKYKTPRNLAAGSVRQLDSSICAKRHLYFYAFDIIKGFENINSRSCKLFLLHNYGFDIVNFFTDILNSYEEIRKKIDELNQYAIKNDIPIDGIVFKYDDIEYGKSLGNTSHHYNDGIAYKFEDETVETVLRSVEWNTTRTGIITPTAIFDTINIDGTEISRASLHNLTFIKNLGLKINDRILVSKRNLIIPHIEENIDISDNYLSFPEICSCCGSNTEIRNTGTADVLYCTNKNCKSRLIDKIVNFCRKESMNIEDFSEATIEKFINLGIITNFVDIYKLYRYKNEIINLEGLGNKSFNNLICNIEESKTCKLENLITGLGINNVGKETAKKISKNFSYCLDNFICALISKYDFSQIEDCGEITNKSIYDWYNENHDLLFNLLKQINVVKQKNICTDTVSVYKDKTIVVTGTLTNFSRNEIQQKIESIGAKFSTSVSKKTDYVLYGESAGSKLQKANELGIKLISEEEFIKNI